ncbi:PAS domain-containing protein [Phenylobacterium sp. LjRoot225]|uniref:sensor histidine kinase n=1 Tax=Phenylobacterium sp. LjRoot225 TaxID=3342285 RepID=UPI003ECC60E0
MEISADDIVETVRSALLVLDADLTVHSANRAFYRTFGVTPEESIGRTIYDLGNGQWDIPALRRLLEEVIPKQEVVEAYEVDHVFETIGRRSFVLNARKVFRPGNGVPFLLLALDDVTEAHDARLDRDRAWALAETIVDTVRDPLVILEGDMTVVRANRSFLQLFDVTAEQIAGRPVGELGEGQWGVAALRDLLLRVVPDSEAFDGYEIEDEFPGLGRRIFKLNARKVFRPGDHVTRLLVVFEDVTEARLLERHRDVLAAELAHRIKNSLQIISSFVAFEMRRAAEPCVAGYRAMQARIGAVSELYDVISRSAAFGPVPVDAYLDGIAASLTASLLGPGSPIGISVAAEPLSISADHAVTLGLIVNELATNAVKHAFPRGEGQIVLGFARQDGEVTLTISDDGVGLAAAGDSGGAKLGSRFVEAFVRQVGGTLSRDSGADGTTFTVRLPPTVLAAG